MTDIAFTDPDDDKVVEDPTHQIHRLGDAIIDLGIREPSRDEGAVDCAIRLLRAAFTFTPVDRTDIAATPDDPVRGDDPTVLAHVASDLVDILTDLGNRYGPKGVTDVARLLAPLHNDHPVETCPVDAARCPVHRRQRPDWTHTPDLDSPVVVDDGAERFDGHHLVAAAEFLDAALDLASKTSRNHGCGQDRPIPVRDQWPDVLVRVACALYRADHT